MTKPPTLDPTWVAFTTTNTFVDPLSTLPVTVLANYDINGNLLYTEAYNADGTNYTGNIATLTFPSFFLAGVLPLLTSIDNKLVQGQQLMASSLSVVIASNQTPIPITGSVTATVPNPLPVSQSGPWTATVTQGGPWTAAVTGIFWQATQPVSIASPIIANPETAFAKVPTYIPLAQAAPGTDVLAVASPGNKHKVVSTLISMSANGTAKFEDSTPTDLTGPMDISATGGFVLPAGILPYFETATGEALSLTTTLGKANGVVVILTEP